MDALVIAIHTYAGWLYLVLGLAMARELTVFWRSRSDLGRAQFALERESANRQAIRAAVTSLLLATIAVGLYAVAVIVFPTMPADRLRPNGPVIAQPPPEVPLPPDIVPTAVPTSTPPVVHIVTAEPER